MYEDILNFLKGKNKKLTEEEASEFIKLLAESVGYEETLSSQTNENDNLSEDISTDIQFVIDDINDDFCEDYESYSLDGLSNEDEEDEDKEYVVLNKRKITRNVEFKRRKQQNYEVEKNNSEIKEQKNLLENDFVDDNKINSQQNSVTELPDANTNVSNTIETLDKKEKVADNKELKDSNRITQCFDEMKTTNTNTLDINENKDLKIYLDNETEEGDVVESNSDSSVDESEHSEKEVEFVLPKFEMPCFESENQAYKFDLGELTDVKNKGPEYKFYDEDNKEI